MITVSLFSSPQLIGFFFLNFLGFCTLHQQYYLLLHTSCKLPTKRLCIVNHLYTGLLVSAHAKQRDATKNFKLMHTMCMNQNTEPNPKDCRGRRPVQLGLCFPLETWLWFPSKIFKEHPLCFKVFMLGHLEISSTDNQTTYHIPGNVENMPKEAVWKAGFSCLFSPAEDSLKNTFSSLMNFCQKDFFFPGLKGKNLIFFSFCQQPWHRWWSLPVTNHVTDATAVLVLQSWPWPQWQEKTSGNPPYTFLSTKPYLADDFWKASSLDEAFCR